MVYSLHQRYPELCNRADLTEESLLSSTNRAPAISSPGGAGGHDHLRAALRALTKETTKTGLFQQICSVVAQLSGADRVALILRRDAEWCVEAILTPDAPEAQVLGPMLQSATGVPRNVAHYVINTETALALQDWGSIAEYVDEEYIARARPESILCLPIHDSEDLVGGPLPGEPEPARRVLSRASQAARTPIQPTPPSDHERRSMRGPGSSLITQ